MSEIPSVPPSHPTSTQTPSPVNKSANSRYVFLIGSGIVALLLISVAYIFYNLGKNTTSQTNPTETIEFVANNFEVEPSPSIATGEPGIDNETPETITRILLADPELDGYIASDGVGNNQNNFVSIRQTQ